ncbi:MAG: hypothetical protein IPI67_41265 [Myxococcales bacterium]|nr:hypothetical protein [Myxococcales bacterium]
MSAKPPPPVAEARRLTTFGLALLLGLVGVFAAFAVPRLTNNAIGDVEFSGWSGPIARYFFSGQRPYIDFVLPIPPGSMLLLAALRHLGGEARLLDELGLIAVCQIAMALLGYTITRPFTTRENALLVAFASAVVLFRGLKECAYDQTAALVVWTSVAFGARALTHARDRTRKNAWVMAGALAAITVFFKQSTAVGALLGFPCVFVYRLLFARVERRTVKRETLAWCLGVGVGLACVGAALVLIDSSPLAFYRAAFADGPALKGGSRSVMANLGHYVLGAPAYPASLLLTVAIAFVLVRLVRSPDGLHLGAHDTEQTLTRRRAALVFGFATLAFGTATALLAAHVRSLPPALAYWTEQLRLVPNFGLFFLALSFVAHLNRPERLDANESQRHSRGHALNCIAAIALSIALAHNLSSPEFRPFYDPNPIIPVALAFLFMAFDQAGLPRAKLGVFCLALAALFSPKLDRMLAADTAIGPGGNWGGLFVRESALPIVKAALRARELTRETDTVLVLPEDLEIAALIGRPRPKLRGAVVFVDQYAPRLLEADLAELERHLPRVVVIRPAERELWAIVFAHWNSNSAAGSVVKRFLDDWLPRHYRRDSSYRTPYGQHMGTLELWVRTDPGD